MSVIAVIGVRGFPGIQGGVEGHCENLYPPMSVDKDCIVRVYRRKPYLTPLSDKTFPNIEYVDLPSTRIKGFEAVLHTFLCVLHIIFNRPDVVHVHNIGPGMFTPLVRLFRIPVVLTYHSPNYEHKKWGFTARMILRMSEWLALGFSNQIIFVNRFQMEKYSPKILAKSQYVPNGIHSVTKSERVDFIDKIGAKKDEYVLGVGRLTPEKGFEYLIKAVNEDENIPQLVIAGASDHDSEYYNKLKSLDTNNKVIFSGFTSGEDLRQLYSHARLFALSSINEGFPLVMLEAMSYSLPMVVSDIPATHLVDLPSYFYVEKENSHKLREGIKRSFSKNESEVVYDLSIYNWNNIADTTFCIYQKALN